MSEAPSGNRLVRRLGAMKKGLVPFLSAGDGGLDRTESLLAACDREGVACVELGVPFSDPIADGPIIQAASQRALEEGTTLTGVLQTVQRFRKSSELPIAIFSYLNPLARLGHEKAFTAIAAAGADAVMLPDVPVEEALPFAEAARENGLCLILFAAPTTSPERLERIAAATSGFLYLIGRFGVTGRSTDVGGSLDETIAAAHAKAKTPLAVGFGIREPAQVEQVLAHAELAVVGSALVQRVHEAKDPVAACGEYLDELLAAVSKAQAVADAAGQPASSDP